MREQPERENEELRRPDEAEKRLRAGRQSLTDEHFRLLVEAAPNALLLVNRAGQIVLVNSQAEQLFGYSRDELLGAAVEMLVPARHRQQHGLFRAGFHNAPEVRKMGAGRELFGLRWDGSEVPVEIGLNPISIADHEFVLISIIDITERRKAQEASAHLAAIVASSADAILSKTLDGIITSWNAAAERMFGYQPEEIIGQSILRLVPADHRQEEDRILARLSAGEHIRHYETVRLTKDGRIIDVSLTISPVKDNTGRITGASSIIRDITERKEFEAAREQLLVREQQARALAEEANRARDEWLAVVTHELRSPLNAMLGYARILDSRRDLPPDLAEVIGIIRRNGERQRVLIDDLLDSARAITGKLRLEIRPLDLAEVIREAIETVRPAAAARQITITSQLEPDAGLITGDPDRLQQVVWNLLINAVKFTPVGGSIYLELKRADEHACLTVTDTGVGIAPEFLPHIFERFSQQDASRSRRYGGLGLGLSLVRQLVELHGGRISAFSAGLNQGATFTIHLPLRAVSDLPADPAPACPSPALRQPPSDSLAGVRVLLIDDEADTLALVAAILKGSGATVIRATSGSEAWPLLTSDAASDRPQIIVCDIGMPDEDGYTLLSRFRDWEHLHHRKALPAVALTAYNSSRDRLQALASGYQMHLAKPVEPEELTAVILSLTARFNSGMNA